MRVGYSTWNPTTLTWDTEHIGQHSSEPGGIAFDADGTPWIAYDHRDDSGSVDVMVATRDAPGQPWRTQTVQANAGGAKIAIGPDDEVHIAYSTDEKVFHAVPDGMGGWTSDTVHNLADGDARQVEIAVDDDNRVHLAWDPYRAEILEAHAVQEASGSWNVTELPGDHCGRDLSLAIEPGGDPWITCRSFGLGLYEQVDGEWRFEVIVDGDMVIPPRGGWLGDDTSLAFGPDGTPHVSFRSINVPRNGDNPLSAGHLLYASKPDGEWVAETVDRSGQQTVKHGLDVATGIAVDDKGRPGIAYVFWRHTFRVPTCVSPAVRDLCSAMHYAQPVSALPARLGVGLP